MFLDRKIGSYIQFCSFPMPTLWMSVALSSTDIRRWPSFNYAINRWNIRYRHPNHISAQCFSISTASLSYECFYVNRILVFTKSFNRQHWISVGFGLSYDTNLSINCGTNWYTKMQSSTLEAASSKTNPVHL